MRGHMIFGTVEQVRKKKKDQDRAKASITIW